MSDQQTIAAAIISSARPHLGDIRINVTFADGARLSALWSDGVGKAVRQDEAIVTVEAAERFGDHVGRKIAAWRASWDARLPKMHRPADPPGCWTAIRKPRHWSAGTIDGCHAKADPSTLLDITPSCRGCAHLEEAQDA
jgi:hypothetical protein